jgi:transcription termination factor Rho
VTETTAAPVDSAGAGSAKKKSGGLNAMLLADLKAMAAGMGISGASSMKKADLISAIKGAQGAGRPVRAEKAAPVKAAAEQPAVQKSEAKAEAPAAEAPRRARTRTAQSQTEAPAAQAAQAAQAPVESAAEGEAGQERKRAPRNDRNAERTERQQPAEGTQRGQGGQANDGAQRNQGNQRTENARNENAQRNNQGGQNNAGNQSNQSNQGSQGNSQAHLDDADGEDGGSRRNRRRRGRDRERPARGNGPRGDVDVEIREDDVLVPAAGILDVLDQYAFVRTSGYLPGPDDVYVSLPMVRKLGLRRGDAVTGQVRQPREGESRQKFNPMVRIDSVNGTDPALAGSRPEFSKLTPLYASERLRMETDATNMIGRVIDIAAPVGKGQRGLIVSPAKAGKTMIMQSIANSITVNNPECHLMVVLVDERPEEVTDFERNVKGEVIASTFDRPATDHTLVAELAIERAKRLVELGHDVVVLLDGITRLGRAYNLAAPASGRILSGGVDAAALYPPKKFFGAARNIENGGSLTILATALVESGSKMDEVIFEEFKGTGNMEIRLRRDLAEKRIFPAIDAIASGTRREELLMSKDELQIIWKLRRVLSALDGQQSLELLLERLRKTQSNIEFLMQVQQSTPGADGV